MRKKNKKILSCATVAMLSASMVAPTVAPAIPIFAVEKEHLRDYINTMRYATSSTPEHSDEDVDDIPDRDTNGDEDIILPDDKGGDSEASSKRPATSSDADRDDTTIEGVEKKHYPVFGTLAFWEWYDEYREDEEVLFEWHNSVAKRDVATNSDADRDYPLFDDSIDPENSPFWKWFFGHAVMTDTEGNVLSYNNSVILDWITHSDYSDVKLLLEALSLMRQTSVLSVTGDLWPSTYGAGADLYDGNHGTGTEESPFLIDSVEDLRSLAVHIANNQNNDGTYYLIKSGTYDLNGSWIPIGFQKNAGGAATAFLGHIAAKDGTYIKNLGFGSNNAIGITADIARGIREQKAVGFFGEIGSGATVTNLQIDTNGNTLEGTDYAGILAGRIVDATIKECITRGKVKGNGFVGGVIGFAESSQSGSSVRNTIIEDCKGDKVAVYTTDAVTGANDFVNGHSSVGGIVGFAQNTTIMDVEVSTNTGSGNHIYGNGSYVGGVAGVIENTDVYNANLTDGEIGSSNAFSTGGLVGGYNKGQLKAGRFSGYVTKPSSGYNYSACFIGSRVNGAGFTYGESGDIAYLFADEKSKADTGICGSRVEDDGIFGLNAHIGYWHPADNFFSLVSGSNVEHSNDYFYKELERGILNIKKDSTANTDTVNHFTSNAQGRPTRGYLLTINNPMVGNIQASEITARSDGNYKPIVTSDSQGAYAPGDVVYISFKDLSDGAGYFQLNEAIANNPWYSYYQRDDFNVFDENGITKGVNKSGGFYFTMPTSDATIGATYKRVSQAVTNNPGNLVVELTQFRTGSRENPTIEWKATAYNGDKDLSGGAQVITDAKGTKWENVTLATKQSDGTVNYYDKEFWISSLVNGSANQAFMLGWSTSNVNNNGMFSDAKPGNNLARDTSAFVKMNVKDSAAAVKVEELELAQKNGNYKDSMTTKSPYRYRSLITSVVAPEDSDDKNNPPKGYTNIEVKLNIVDNTSVSVNGVALSRNNVTYEVVRILSGSRKNPKVSYTVNGSDLNNSKETISDITATFQPDYFSNSSVDWYLSQDKGDFTNDKGEAVPGDSQIKDDGTLNVAVNGSGDKAYYNAAVTLKGMSSGSCDNAQIKQWVTAQDMAYTKEMKKVPEGNTYTYSKYVKVTAGDTNNNSVTDTCKVTVNFKTVDETEIMPESVEIDNKTNVHGYNIRYAFKSDNASAVETRTITMDDAEKTRLSNGVGEDLSATVSPIFDDNANFKPYDKGVVWSLVNPDTGTNLNPYDVLAIDSQTGQITVRGYNGDNSGNGYSPWVQSLISEGKLDGVTVPIRVIAKSTRDGSLVDYKDINVGFTASTMAGQEDPLEFSLVLTKNTATSLSGTGIEAKETWSGTEPQQYSATATGTNEAPVLSIVDAGGRPVSGIISLTDPSGRSVTTTKNVAVNLNAPWIQNIIKARKSGNTDTETVTIKAQTTNGTALAQTPVKINFRYDGTDMTAETMGVLPAGYPATPDATTSGTPTDTYDLKKASVKDRQITLGVVAKQGNYSVDNPETRKWSYGIAALGNTTYSAAGVKENDAVYELSGDIASYCRVSPEGYLVPTKGNWNEVINAGQTKGSVSGVVTAKKDIDGKVTTDSYKVTIEFRYDKAVIDSREETFDVVYTQDSQTNSIKSHWTGDNYIQLRAAIHDEGGQDVTPKWETSDPDIVTVDKDGRVHVNKETWMKSLIQDAQVYGNKPHTAVKTAYVTAKHPTTGETADTCEITVNFRYDQSIIDKHEETYDLVLTQESRTNRPSVKWSGNGIRKLNAEIYVAPGLNNTPFWSSENRDIVTVDDAGNIESIINADWQHAIVKDGKFAGQKKVAVNAADRAGAVKDSCNVTVNFRYENVVMNQNAKTMDMTLTASGNRNNPSYTITGSTDVLSAVVNSAKEGEKIRYTSSDSGLIKVDENGALSLILPESMTGTQFGSSASAFIKEAMGHAYTTTNPYVSTTNVVIQAATEDGRMADQCNLKLNLKYIDNTYSSGGNSSGGSGGGGGGGGGGSSSTGRGPAGTTTATVKDLPAYVLKGGDWTQNAAGNWFYTNSRTFTNEWAAVQNPYADTSKGQQQYDWFHFNADSSMTTGWFTDEAGNTFFLHNISDNTLGYMYTGWRWIDDDGDGIAQCYYFNPESNGLRGMLYRSTVTPDGNTVNEKGQLVQGNMVQTMEIKKEGWSQDATGEWFYTNGRTFKDEWAAVAGPFVNPDEGLTSWFHFGTDSSLDTGWYTDDSGNTYFLENVPGKTFGQMYTGWNWLDANGDGISECYYFDETAAGLGRLYRSTVTPDGNTVDETGKWVG